MDNRALDFINNRGLSLNKLPPEILGYCSPYTKYPFALLKGRITVSNYDVNGNLISFSGRQFQPMIKETINVLSKLEDDKISKWLRSKWLNESFDKSNHLFNLFYAKNIARVKGYMILVEGYFDALALYCNDFKNTCANSGVSFSERQAILLKRYCDRVICIFDPDEAGDRAYENTKNKLEPINIQTQKIILPNKLDPDDFIKENKFKFNQIIEHTLKSEKEIIKIK